MGVDDSHTLAVIDVLEDQVAKKGRFAGSGLPDAIDMLAPVAAVKTEGLGSAPKLTHAKIARVFVIPMPKIIVWTAHIPDPAAPPSGLSVNPRRVGDDRTRVSTCDVVDEPRR